MAAINGPHGIYDAPAWSVTVSAAELQAAATQAAIAKAAAGESLTRSDMIAIFGISPATYHRYKKSHAFDRFRLSAPMGVKLYSGVQVTRFLAGDVVTPGGPSRLSRRRG